MTYLTTNITGATATLTMTQPDTLNSLSNEMLAALQEAFDTLAPNTDVKTIILKGQGKAFCAGHNLKQMQAARQTPDHGAQAFKDLFSTCAALMHRIRTQPQIVIAQIHGIATAAGCQLAATCDMVIASETARFGVNGVNIGLFCSTPMVALTRAIGQKAAFEMLTTGRFLYADEALSLGLITRTAPGETLDAETQELADQLNTKLGSALRTGKRTFYDQIHLAEPDAYALAGAAMVENTLNSDTAEGISAFLEKRPPNWAD